eukprot:4417385-Pleurochrysis_carterae.AAC.4
MDQIMALFVRTNGHICCLSLSRDNYEDCAKSGVVLLRRVYTPGDDRLTSYPSVNAGVASLLVVVITFPGEGRGG